MDPHTGLKVLPHWVAQPYTRPLLDVTGKKPSDKSAADVAVSSAAEGTSTHNTPGFRLQGLSLVLVRTETVILKEEDVMLEVSGGKRTPSQRTPEPDVVLKRAKLVENAA